jgi:hypothetical protein
MQLQSVCHDTVPWLISFSLGCMLPVESRRAPPVGRVLRVLLGVGLIAYVLPVYFQVPQRIIVGSLLLVLGLIGVYSLIFAVLSRRIAFSNQWLVAVAASGVLVVLYILGGSRLPIVGGGIGQLAAATFLGISLLVAGLRAVPACELMAIPSLFFGNHIDLPCLIFSPLDKLEHKLRRKDAA